VSKRACVSGDVSRQLTQTLSHHGHTPTHHKNTERRAAGL
jgi:hypothetical protein